jgi:tetratricopeptide (TPR) repeat protein
MNRTTLICMLLPLAALVSASGARAATTCKAPTMIPAHGVMYIDRNPATAHLDDHFDMADPARAAFINGALRNHPENARLRLGRGSALAVMHRRQAAMADFAAVLRDHPFNAHARWSFGWAQFNLGDDACALRQWQRAAKMDGGHPAWLPYAVAESYWRMGRHNLALQWFDAAVRAQPSRWSSEASIRAATYGYNWSDAQRTMLIQMLHAWKQRTGGHADRISSVGVGGSRSTR